MNYLEKLEESAKFVKNIACMGLDPKKDVLPESEKNIREVLNDYFYELFRRMSLSGLIPAAFKPNIGYYQCLDKPREENFDGSLALSDLLDMLENFFPSIPVILDSKRGDIARSSLNYAIEAFDCWNCDATTVSPYMGSDSVSPFQVRDKGLYVLNRTSNPGGKDLQNLMCGDNPLYIEVCQNIVKWSENEKGIGAVVGATSMKELLDIAKYYSDKKIPLLIPGVGSQGGSAQEVIASLNEANYPLYLARINSSSGLTHPWKKGHAPEDWLDLCTKQIRELLDETAI
ncbi:MAG: orotidine-5'-phosphate decarboxylase [Spirochaetia bacterium]|nr:orotidine-5'-phosphate decarboxylase [Spirochaetia bacterium]